MSDPLPPPIRSHRDLHVWRLALDLAEQLYLLTQRLPADERWGLSSQLKRAAISVPSNIAEGFGRASTKDYIRYLNVALGSVGEIETQLLLVGRLELIPDDVVAPALERVQRTGRMLSSLVRSLRDSARRRRG